MINKGITITPFSTKITRVTTEKDIVSRGKYTTVYINTKTPDKTTQECISLFIPKDTPKKHKGIYTKIIKTDMKKRLIERKIKPYVLESFNKESFFTRLKIVWDILTKKKHK